jgi:hypothetical protein
VTETNDDTRWPGRAWVVLFLAGVFVCWIGWNTQTARNETDRQAQQTTDFARQTNECLSLVIGVLKTRVGYNEQLDTINQRRVALDARRQVVWEKLVADLAQANNSDGLNMEALKAFMSANAEVKAGQVKLLADEAKLTQDRNANAYPEPNCGIKLPER